MDRLKDRSDMIIFAHSHQDPSRTVLNVLQVNKWDFSQNKKINYTSNTIFLNMVLVI